jgi:Polyketide cyclase / dehydrase and lipid transport
MKWIWIVLGILAVAIALIAIIGAMLPVKHKASRRARYRQSPEAVWAAISPDRDGRKMWRESIGGNDPITFELIEANPPRRMVTRIADTNLPFGGAWTYEIEPLPDGSSLRVTEDGEVYNPIFRFVSRFIMGHTKSIDDRLRGLAKKFGEDVRIEE